jgi:hypothetical protein
MWDQAQQKATRAIPGNPCDLGNMVGGTAAVPKQSELSYEVGSLQGNTGALEKQVATLEQRLGPVLRPACPSDTEKKSEMPSTGVATVLREQNNTLNRVLRTLVDITERIEV